MRERLEFAERATTLAVGPFYPIVIGVEEPVLLRVEAGKPQIGVKIAQSVRIVQTGSSKRQDRYTVSVARYVYALMTADGREILAFHWTPDAADPNQRRFPHLHVGAVNLDANGPIRPGTFHKMHIPTGPVSIEAIVRLAITEFNVLPLRSNWEQVLRRTESAQLDR